MASGLDRPTIQIDSWPPPPPEPFEGDRVQRERITRAEIEAFGTNAGCPGCDAIRSWKASSSPLRRLLRIEERLKMTPEGAERLDRRSEVLNEAVAREG